MFGGNEFRRLYQMLDLEMYQIDCGVQCGKFCCVEFGDESPAFKYLLPGEVEFLVGHNFHRYASLEDYGFLIRYRAERMGECACEQMRRYRPFCCRMFPFRPVIDELRQEVVELVKAANQHLSPCWIDAPQPEWRSRAIGAWNYLFSDRNNLEFYARYYLCLKKSESSELSYAQALATDDQFRESVENLNSISQIELWRYCKMFFDYILTMDS